MNNKDFFKGWIIGLTDGEGNFIVEISKVKDMVLNEKVQLNFNITQHWANEKILYLFLEYFNCGHVTWNNKKNGVRQFRVRDLQDLRTIIIPFFIKYPLLGRKQLDLKDFIKVADMMSKGLHLTPDGLREIKLIKAGMNRGRVKITTEKPS